MSANATLDHNGALLQHGLRDRSLRSALRSTAMALGEDRAIDRRIAQQAAGTVEVWAISAHIYVTRCAGNMSDPHADLLIDYAQEMKRRAHGHGLIVFHDWLRMTGYAPGCRARLTTWSVANLSCYASVHMALQSKIVAMGVSVANLALGGIITTHSDLESLDAKLAEVIGRKSSGNSVPPPATSRHRP